MHSVDAPDDYVVPEVPDDLYRMWVLRVPNFDSGKPWVAAKYQARKDREERELAQWGELRPTLPDDSTDPRVLARDLVLHNLGDGRPLRRRERAAQVREFAHAIGVLLDLDQTYPPRSIAPIKAESEIRTAAERHRKRGSADKL